MGQRHFSTPSACSAAPGTNSGAHGHRCHGLVVVTGVGLAVKLELGLVTEVLKGAELL